MFLGEIRKVIRNKMFLVIMFAVFAANMITILYFTKNTDEFYYYVQNTDIYESYLSGENEIDESYLYYYRAKEQEQKQYIETYDDFILNMTERGNQVLLTFDASEESYLNKEIEKTSDDYRKLENISLEADVNIGMEEYASYSYGIFFMILTSFILIEFLYFQERRNSLLGILRTTKKGRMKLAFTKWGTGLVLLIGTTLIQEIITLIVYGQLYGMGNLSGHIQNLEIFRDCAYAMTNLEAMGFVIALRVLIASGIFSLIYMCTMVFDQMIVAVFIPGAIFALQYVLDQILQFNGSFDYIKAMNVFNLWNMENSIGMYHNLNIFGMPFDKNIVAVIFVLVCMIICLCIGIGGFGIRYQNAYKKLQLKLLEKIRNMISKLLHVGNLTVNEIYKLLFQQKKWILVVLLILYAVSNRNAYVPKELYRTAYEAAYHMYLSNIQGKCTEDAIVYIEEQTQQIEQIQLDMEEAERTEDAASIIQLSADYEYRIEGYDRLMEQYEYLKLDGDLKDKYFVDELFLDQIWSDYETDIFQFAIFCIGLTLLLSGVYTADVRYQTEKMIACTRKGRHHLQKAKNICAAVTVMVFAVLAEVPKIIAYGRTIEFECFNQKLLDLYDPAISSSMTIGGFILLVFVCRFVLLAMLALLVIMIARKTKNELLTSAIGIIGVVLVALLLYYMQTDVTIFLMEHI